jgi:hypothetical protein
MASQDEREIEIQARVIALEHLVKRLLWIVITNEVERNNGDSEEVVSETTLLASDIRDELETASLTGIDPTMSDHATALVRENTERIFLELVEMMETRLLGRQSSSRGEPR